ncbi:ATP-binding protein [Eleftheria terrae]|uniref:ATP-binding protein n=1 Tax=Eleftheria terrae TaxID=1597781 RepID=UPI00263ABB74|nr:ATP-binding protein [Eleftheria terrae]WKB55596.1 ATP-binding protein [Eleftheria terrae]
MTAPHALPGHELPAGQAALPPLFPFSALAGPASLRTALLLAAVDPALGGVLIEGPRGTAKSTAARALAELLPDAAFVALPLGGTVEHLVGTLDLQEALAGHRLRFAPGLLARAHGGVLYVDEVNLLPDPLVDVLLDVAASGVNVIERDGISHRHAARFVLVGTMNPEEGELRPQLLDRFGLCVRLSNLSNAEERAAVVRERLAFDADPLSFRERHAPAQAALAARLAAARARLAQGSALPFDDELHVQVSRLCIAAEVDGLRADLVMLRAARALAAWQGAAAIEPAHVQQVSELVLAHRRPPGAAPAERTPAPGEAGPPPAGAGPLPAAATRGGGAPAADPVAAPGAPAHGEAAHWGALPPEPAGLAPVKPLRALREPAAKKA